MRFDWIDYPAQYEDEIETWCDEAAVCFALDDDSVKIEHQWYLDSDNYTYNSDYFCKIIFDGETPVAILMMAKWNEATLRLNENVIYLDTLIINPALRNQGYGTRIVTNVMKRVNQLVGDGTNIFIAQIHKDNDISKKLAGKLGFHRIYLDFMVNDTNRDWFDWIYPLSAAERFIAVRYTK